MKRTALYAGVGPLLMHYDLDVDGLALVKRKTLKLINNVQYAWPHASKPFLYVATSSKVSSAEVGNDHYLYALAIDPNTGDLSVHGEPVKMSNRALHVTTDRESKHLLAAFNNPTELQIYRIDDDGTIGERIAQRSGIDCGKFPHQIRITADDELAILVTRGNPYRGHDAHLVDQVDTGALKVFQYKKGVLGDEVSIAPGGGRRFGPRHLDFHQTAPWVFVSLETQNKLYVFKREGKRILPDPLFTRDLLVDPNNTHTHQGSGTLHMHPNGKILYCVNRGHAPSDYQGKKVVLDPDNCFVVFSVNEATGEPTFIQRIDAGGLCPRTFAVHPSGRMLVAANAETHLAKHGSDIREICANLAVFEMKPDGTLRFARKYDTPLMGSDKLFWAGMVDY